MVNRRWITGQELLSEPWYLKRFEILQAVKDGHLTPYHEKWEEKVVDIETLPKKYLSLEEIKNNIRKEEARKEMIRDSALLVGKRHSYSSRGRKLTESEIEERAKSEFRDQKGEPITPPGCVAAYFTLNTITDFNYKVDEVRSYLEELNPKSADGERNKRVDIGSCRKAAKQYVADCAAKGMTPAIMDAIGICQTNNFGMNYSDRQIRGWITKSPKIFPKESSKKGRRKITK
jgi:hypothetical protein